MWRPSRVCPVLCLNHAKKGFPHTAMLFLSVQGIPQKVFKLNSRLGGLPLPGVGKMVLQSIPVSTLQRYDPYFFFTTALEKSTHFDDLMQGIQVSAVQCSKTEHKEMIKPRQFFENITHFRNFFVSLCQCKVNCQTKPIDKRQVLRIFSLQ